jgi:hypothetical protein
VRVSVNELKRVRDLLREDSGSVTPLIITYFLITLMTIFIGINITHASLERRHLTLAIEASLQRASQAIDDASYYSGYVERNRSNFRSRGVTTFVPIDCSAARKIFDEEFSTQWALTKALNLPDLSKSPQSESYFKSIPGLQPESQRLGIRRPISTPQLLSFSCDGETLAASAELLVELPFRISFAGVDLAQYSRQLASVEVGLVLSEY